MASQRNFALPLLALAGMYSSAEAATPTASNFTEVTSFAIPKPPTGLFFDGDDSKLLYILCEGSDQEDPTLHVFSTSGKEKCIIKVDRNDLPMVSPDGFFVDHATDSAYFVDSSGPGSSSSLGGSLYEVKWTDPCTCSSGNCKEKEPTWSPEMKNKWALNVANVSATEGGGNDQSFRNSGVVVLNDAWFGVNGVHDPTGNDMTNSYPKSIVEFNMTTSMLTNSWSFDGSTIGHDVDMEGLSCGPDECADSLFVGDEYNYIYQLDFDSGKVSREWNLNSIVGNVDTNKGIEALTYASTTGCFYAGVQNTSTIHVVRLEGATEDGGSAVLRSMPILGLAILVGLVTTMG